MEVRHRTESEGLSNEEFPAYIQSSLSPFNQASVRAVGGIREIVTHPLAPYESMLGPKPYSRLPLIAGQGDYL